MLNIALITALLNLLGVQSAPEAQTMAAPAGAGETVAIEEGVAI
ncbi:hypothetical protein [Gallaecimonas sp. GXIMD4217]